MQIRAVPNRVIGAADSDALALQKANSDISFWHLAADRFLLNDGGARGKADISEPLASGNL